jgi:hypothetical protein
MTALQMRLPSDSKSPRPVSRRGLQISCDDEDMPVICPTCQIHLGAGRLNGRAVNFVDRSFVQRKLFFPPDSLWNGPAAESGGRFTPWDRPNDRPAATAGQI